jgi:hypothetical protein
MKKNRTGKLLAAVLLLAGSVFLNFLVPSVPAVAIAAEPGIPSGIVWYGVLADGLAEARRAGKPILLVSAAPQCIGISGMW